MLLQVVFIMMLWIFETIVTKMVNLNTSHKHMGLYELDSLQWWWRTPQLIVFNLKWHMFESFEVQLNSTPSKRSMMIKREKFLNIWYLKFCWRKNMQNFINSFSKIFLFQNDDLVSWVSNVVILSFSSIIFKAMMFCVKTR